MSIRVTTLLLVTGRPARRVPAVATPAVDDEQDWSGPNSNCRATADVDRIYPTRPVTAGPRPFPLLVVGRGVG